MKIRRAVEADVPEMLALHRAAVQRTGKGYYSSEILNAWSWNSDPERFEATIARMRQNMLSAEVVSFVAENTGTIVAFGDLMPASSVLGAVYVHPDYGRQGIGSQMVATLEELAKEFGLLELTMDASLNAEAFYASHGFEVIERAEHELRNGLKMPCVKMRKSLLSTVIASDKRSNPN